MKAIYLCKDFFVEAFSQRSFYTQKRLHNSRPRGRQMAEICFQKAPGQDLAKNGRFPQWNLYTGALSHREAFTAVSQWSQKRNTEAFTQRSLYTHRWLLHKASPFTRKGAFYTQKVLQPAFSLYFEKAEELLHTKAFTHSKLLHTQGLLHKEVLTQRSFLHTEGFTQRSLYPKELLHTNV